MLDFCERVPGNYKPHEVLALPYYRYRALWEAVQPAAADPQQLFTTTAARVAHMRELAAMADAARAAKRSA